MYHMHCPMIGFTKYLFLYLTNIFTVDLRDWLCNYLELSPPKPLDQSKNVTVRSYHKLSKEQNGAKKCAHGHSQDKCPYSIIFRLVQRFRRR